MKIIIPKTKVTRENWSNRKSDKHFYVTIDNIEKLDDKIYQIVFDGVERSNLNLFRQSSIIDTFEEFRTLMFRLTLDDNKYTQFKNLLKSGRFKSKWYHLIITKLETNLPVSIINEENNNTEFEIEESFVHVLENIHVNNEISKILNNYFSWNSFSLSNKADIDFALRNASNYQESSIHKLNVYNVGQGSLTAITNEENVPLLYFDLGGGFAWNKSTYLNRLNLCFSYTRTVIISHWDRDHLETARRYFATNPTFLNNVTWIVPEQKISPMYFKLAARMSRSGNLLIWPKTLKGRISSWFGDLIKCNGPDKNHSGLAMIVDSPNNSIQKVLNPADAAYKYIPSIKKIKFDGLIATHHGANFVDNNLPVPNSIIENGNIIYSFGTSNTYGHPKHSAVLAHESSNWINALNTENGNISFTTNNTVLITPCNNTNCDLNIIQTF